jgi:hypothetical protein
LDNRGKSSAEDDGHKILFSIGIEKRSAILKNYAERKKSLSQEIEERIPVY